MHFKITQAKNGTYHVLCNTTLVGNIQINQGWVVAYAKQDSEGKMQSKLVFFREGDYNLDDCLLEMLVAIRNELINPITFEKVGF